MTHRFAEVLQQFAHQRILVLGDVMLDTFVYGHCTRISPEAPIPVIRIERQDVMLGGAGNVARNIAALGGEAVLIGVVGDDATGATMVAKIAEEPHIVADMVTDARPTTHKIRYVAAQQQMLRADSEVSAPGDPAPLLDAVLRQLTHCHAVILSDYAKGVLTPDLLRQVIAHARAAGKPIIGDPKNTEIGRYDGVTLLTPNAHEAAAAAGLASEADDEVEKTATRLLAAMPNSAAVLITRGPKGMTLAQRSAPASHYAAVAREVFDVSGAGDTVVATLGLALAAGLDLSSAAELANVAAGKAVSKPGTAVVTTEELAQELDGAAYSTTDEKIVTLEEALHRISLWRGQGDLVGFTNGCFDLIHPGHVSQLNQGRQACDRLVVGLNTDASVQRLKGPARPIQNEDARAIVLAALSPVDLVVLFDEDTPLRLIERIRPDVLVKGKDYSIEQVVGSDLVLGYGGRVVLADLLPGHSTTGIVARMGS